METVSQLSNRIIQNIEKVIVGKREAVEMTVLGLLCQGHVLIEDVPGVGKTMLARSLARSIGCTFNRIQCTPDMLPSDITGVYIYNQAEMEFEFRPGPIINQIVLADEVNRATPKTQAALLEAMQERQVTVSGVTHDLPRPFMILATQNPIEYEGTFPLPEAQLDRFLIKVRLGYPEAEDEIDVLERQKIQHPFHTLEPVVSEKEILAAQKWVREVYIADQVKEYIVHLVQETRNVEDVYLGASPRGSLALSRACQAWASMHDRTFVIPDDVITIIQSALSHRIILSSSARLEDLTSSEIIQNVLEKIPVPGGDYEGE
jgi:MoxR-like ATPase